MSIFLVNGEKNHSRQKLHFSKHGPVLSVWRWTSAINQGRWHSLGTGTHLNCYFSIIVQSLCNSFREEGEILQLQLTTRAVKGLSHHQPEVKHGDNSNNTLYLYSDCLWVFHKHWCSHCQQHPSEESWRGVLLSLPCHQANNPVPCVYSHRWCILQGRRWTIGRVGK